MIDGRAPVAQWIERRPPEPKVAGSNPVGRARTRVLFLSHSLWNFLSDAAKPRRVADTEGEDELPEQLAQLRHIGRPDSFGPVGLHILDKPAGGLVHEPAFLRAAHDERPAVARVGHPLEKVVGLQVIDQVAHRLLGGANPLGKLRDARPLDGQPLEDRVVGGPDLGQASCASQPGFQAIYYGRTGELEAVSIRLFEDRESADAAAITMNAQPLLDGQIPEMEAFGPMLERLPGLCQAYFLRTPDGATRIALTFWTSAKALAAGGAAVGSWQASEAAAGRPPAFAGTEASILTDLQVAIAGISSTMPAVV
jgi:heme-degrading monooxygenase HmoA